MKLRRIILPIVALSLTGCAKKPLVIPTVDVEHLKPTLPAIPKRNSGALRTDSNYEYIDLYELSDFHGAVNYENDGHTYVGLKKLSTYFENKRSANKGGTVILSCGDMFQGSADSNLTRGYMVNYCMQYMGFDAMAIGNHEFDWTDTWLKKNAELKYNTSSIPFLGANITKKGSMPSFIKKSTIVKRGVHKIGVIGVIGNDLEDTILKSCVKDYEFSPYAGIVEAEATSLRSNGCDAVVLLAHEGVDNIETVNGVDAIFGGHAHDDTITTINGVPAAATENYGQSVAHMALRYNKSTHEFDSTVCDMEAPWDQMSDVAPSLKEDKNIATIMNSYASELDKIKNIKLGKCDDELTFDGALKNICTKTMYESTVKFVTDNKGYKIDSKKIVCALTNHKGGIRANIQKGKIYYKDVYKSFPFDNELVLVEVSGKVLSEHLEDVSQLGIYRTFEKLSAIKDSGKYYVVTTDYLALTNQFKPLKEVEEKDLIRTGKILRDEIAYKIYDVDKIKNAEWDPADDYHFSPVSSWDLY